MTPPNVDELPDDELARKYRERAKANRERQRQFAQAMREKGNKRITAIITAPAYEALQALKNQHGMTSGEMLNRLILGSANADEGNKTDEVGALKAEIDRLSSELETIKRATIHPPKDRAESKPKPVSGGDSSGVVQRVAELDKELENRAQVAERLNAEGYRTRRGIEWTPGNLNTFLKRERERRS